MVYGWGMWVGVRFGRDVVGVGKVGAPYLSVEVISDTWTLPTF